MHVVFYKKNFYKKMSLKKPKTFCRQKLSESSCARKKTVDTDIRLRYRIGDRKIMQRIRIMSGPATRSTRIRKWSKFRQFRWTYSKVTPKRNNQDAYILSMSQGFQIDSNCRTNSPIYQFLQFIWHIQVTARSTHPDKTTVFPFKAVQ